MLRVIVMLMALNDLMVLMVVVMMLEVSSCLSILPFVPLTVFIHKSRQGVTRASGVSLLDTRYDTITDAFVLSCCSLAMERTVVSLLFRSLH